MSYIKREPLLATAKELQGKPFGAPLIVRAIESAPNEDVVKVVRCEDCIYRHTPDCSLWYGSFGDTDYIRDMGDHFYCSCGERNENGT